MTSARLPPAAPAPVLTPPSTATAGGESLAPDPVTGGAVDLEVEHQHEHERAVEGADGGEDGVAVVLADHADAAQLGVVAVVAPAEEGRDGDGHGHQPHHADHEQDLAGAALADVVDVGDGPEAVHGDGHQVQDGGRAAQHVHRHPHVAHRAAQVPVHRHLRGGIHIHIRTDR